MIVFTCNLSLLILCQLPKVLFGGIYKNGAQKYSISVSSMKGKNHPCAVMNIHNDVGVCFSTVKSDLFFFNNI